VNWIEQIKAARRVSVPIVAINTPDPASTMSEVCTAINSESPKIEWDLLSGLSGRNDAGANVVAQLIDSDLGDETKHNPTECLVKAIDLPSRCVLFVHMASRWLIDQPSFVQALWNLRDRFKRDGRMIVLLGKQFQIPTELVDDIVLIDEPLPSPEQLSVIVSQQHENAKLPVNDDTLKHAVEAVTGLSAFSAEQATAMCLTKQGVSLDDLWESKRSQIEQTPGLKVFRDGQTFDSIGGCDVVKGFLRRIMGGQRRPNSIVFIDEIEKMLGGTGDTSGVSQDQLGALLSYMQDNACAGMIFVGPPGAAKSAVAKAAGNDGGVPTIQLDLGAAKGSLVGQSEHQLRDALKVISAVSNNRSLWIATCNSIGDLPPELRRRFTLGTFFFDLPSDVERSHIWQIYCEAYGFQYATTSDFPDDTGWTGAEIKQCCDIVDRLGCTLEEAAEFIVPVSRSAAGQIKRLREQSDGRFLSASYPGVYSMKRESATTSNRNLDLG